MADSAAVAPVLLQALLGGSVGSEAAVALQALFTAASVRVVRCGGLQLASAPFCPHAADAETHQRVGQVLMLNVRLNAPGAQPTSGNRITAS